jgi:hypothetical protein
MRGGERGEGYGRIWENLEEWPINWNEEVRKGMEEEMQLEKSEQEKNLIF